MRNSSDISVYRPSEGDPIVTVPITPQARRRWRLMEEDSITLEFNLNQPIAFQIGDYIDDEIFGRFYISEESLPPDYDTNTGAYKYSLRFDRDYILWKNKVFKLTYLNPETLRIVGKETTWTLTDVLEAHIQELIRNLFASGYFVAMQGQRRWRCTFSYSVDGEHYYRLVVSPDGTSSFVEYEFDETDKFSGVTDRASMATITYDGANIIDALTNAICKTYKCEWWVKDNVLCLGKCEYGEMIDFRLDKESDSDVINVESMAVNRNEEQYANRLYVFGSTKNIPYRYRKKLEFIVGEKTLYNEPYSKDYSLTVSNNRLTMSAGGSCTDFIPVSQGDVIRIMAGQSRLSGYVCLVGLSGIPSSVSDVGSYTATVLAGYEAYQSSSEGYEPIEVTITSSAIKCVVAADSMFDAPILTHGQYSFRDTQHKLLQKYFNVPQDSYTMPFQWIGRDFYGSVNITTAGKYRLRGTIYYYIAFLNSVGAGTVYSIPKVRLGNTYVFEGKERVLYAGGNNIVGSSISIDIELPFTVALQGFYLEPTIRIVGDNQQRSDSDNRATSDVKVELVGGESIETTISYGTKTNQKVIFNPQNGKTDYSEFVFVDSSGKIITPNDIDVNTKFIIIEGSDTQIGILPLECPDSFYSSDFGDLNTNKLIGERRLLLPSGTSYIGEDLPKEQIVEKVVVFEDVYPKCGLRIVGLHAEERDIETETYADGSKRYEKAVNYFIAVKRITTTGDKEFPFNEGFVDMRIPGEPLQIKFLTQDETLKYGPVGGGSYMLSGLTFNVGINESGSLIEFIDDETGETCHGFQIERTNEYKAYLPNEVMRPTKGDALVLSGWDSDYMETLGLIDTAENELLSYGEEYKKILETDLFTFENRMMSDWAQEVGILPIGQKVTIHNNSLTKNGIKKSRVIGYELKLDIPEDSPIYIVGETEAYSRLKALERELNAESMSASAAGIIAGGGGGGGGGDLDILQVWRSLTNDESLAFVTETTKISEKHLSLPQIIDKARELLDSDDLFFKAPDDTGEEITIDDPGVTGTVLWGAESTNQVALSVNGVSKTLLKAQSLDGIFSRLGVLEGYFVGGSAYNAVRLGGHEAGYYAAASVVDALVTGVSSVAGIKGDVTTTQIADALIAAGYKLTDTIYTLPEATANALGGIKIGYTTSGKNYAVQLSNGKAYVNVPWTDTIYTLPKASANALGGIRVGNGLSIDANGILSVVGQTLGTVTRVDVGSSQYSPDTNGVVSLPAYPVIPTVVSAFTNDAGYLTAITSAMVTTALGYTPFNAANFTKANIKSTLGISDWALADTKPSYDFSEIGSKPTTLAGYGITDAKFSSAGVADKIRITLGSNYRDVLTAHQSLTGYATESWVNQQGFITKAVNDLTNYYLKTETYTQDEVNSLIGAINQFRYEIATSTSAVTDPKSNVLYLIGPTGSGSDRYEEYVYPNATAGWTKIGDTSIDLSSYVNSVVASGSGNYVAGFSKSGNKLTLTLGTLPTTLPASDVYPWAKKANLDAADVPNLAISKITGLQDALDGKQDTISDLSTIRTHALHGEAAYNWGNHASAGYQTIADTQVLEETLSTAISNVSGRVTTIEDWFLSPELDELVVRSLNVIDVINGTAHNSELLGGNTPDHYAAASRVTNLESYFTNGVANSAARLSGTDAYSIWGVEYWANGVPKSVTGRPNLYIGTTQVQTASQSQNLAGIGTIAASGLATIQGGISLGGQYNSADSKLVWDAENNAWHLIGNFYADGFITAGGVGSGGGGGGIDIDRMWESLTNNTDKPNVKINIAHIPDMASTYGYLKGNQNITLTGVVTGSGTTSIATSIADGALSIAMVNGLQTALNGKQATINDLSTIRERANEGHTIYGYFTDGILDLAHMPLDNRLSYVDPEAGEEITIEDAGETGTVLWGAESANQVSLSVNGVSKTLLKAQSLDGIYSRIGVLEGYFTGGSAYNAVRLGGHESNFFATATDLDALEVVVSGKQDTISDLATIRTQAAHGETAYGWGNHANAGYLTSVPTASADTLGLIKVGSGLVINNGVLSVTGQTQGTVTRVDVGSSQYQPDVSGVVTLPAYPTSLPASDVYAWAKAENKPSYAFSEISGKATASQVPNIESLANFGTRVYDATASRNANTVLAAPNGANGAASFRALVADDIPSLTTAKISDLETWISGKAYITKAVNDLTNYYLKSEVESLIGAINQFHYEIYATLPATGEGNVLYLIGPSGSGADKYEEYVYANSTWTKIGETTIDLSSYVNSVVASGTGNYVAGFTKSGNTLTLTMGKLPTTLPASDVYSWAKAEHLAFASLPSMYIGTTAVRGTSQAQDLTGITSINGADLVINSNSGETTVNSELRVYGSSEGDDAAIYFGKNDNFYIQLSSGSFESNLTTVGTITSGVWNGTAIERAYLESGVQTSLGKADTAYQKPSAGIPKTDLASAVQTSLGLADTAYQKPSAGIPKSDLASAVQTSLGLADTAVQPATLHETELSLSEAISNVSGRVTTIENWFLSPELDELTVTSLNVIDVINGEAKSATRLSGTSAYSIWGIEYWANGVPKSVTGQPTLYIGTTRVQTSSQAQDLEGIGSITATGALTLSSTKRIYFGDTDHYLELDSTGFHFSHGVYSEGFMTAGGQGSGGGGSTIDLNRVWESLTNNTDKPNILINTAHIPDMASVYGYIKGNQTITLSGDVTGTGTTSIVTTIGAGKVTNAMLAGSIAATKLAIDLNWVLIGDSASYDTEDYIHINS